MLNSVEANEIEADIKLRAWEKGEEKFIFSTWLRNYKHSSLFAKRISSETFFYWHHRLIEAILSRQSTHVVIATPSDDENLIIGFLVAETSNECAFQILHYVYVKKPFRHMGIGKRMAIHLGIGSEFTFTHWTYDVDSIAAKYPKMIYNPYLT